MKIGKPSEFYTGENCPSCGRNRLLKYECGLTICEKCEYCVETKTHIDLEDEALEEDRLDRAENEAQWLRDQIRRMEGALREAYDNVKVVRFFEQIQEQGKPEPILEPISMATAMAALVRFDMVRSYSQPRDVAQTGHAVWGIRIGRGGPDRRDTLICPNKKCRAVFARKPGEWFKHCPECGLKMDGRKIEEVEGRNEDRNV